MTISLAAIDNTFFSNPSAAIVIKASAIFTVNKKSKIEMVEEREKEEWLWGNEGEVFDFTMDQWIVDMEKDRILKPCVLMYSLSASQKRNNNKKLIICQVLLIFLWRYKTKIISGQVLFLNIEIRVLHGLHHTKVCLFFKTTLNQCFFFFQKTYSIMS